MMQRRIVEREGVPGVFEFLRMGYLRLSSEKVTSNAKERTVRLARIANSFLRLVSNTDVSSVPQRELDALYRGVRISRIQRKRASGIDSPRRTYLDDLMPHYLLAVSSNNSVVEYHVLEHFFEAVFNDDLISSVQDQLTFSVFHSARRRVSRG